MRNDIKVSPEHNVPLLEEPVETLQLQAANNDPRKKYYLLAVTTGMTVLFFVGSGAGILYWAPSLTCAQSNCGKFLSNLITESGARLIYFGSGLFGYGGSNAFFSAASLPCVLQYMSAQKTFASKLAKGIVLGLLTGSQTVSIFLIATSTGSSPLLTIISVGGSIPGALYTSINLMENDFPNLFSKIKIKVINNSSCFSSAFAKQKEYYQHYQSEHKQFIRKLVARWKAITEKADKMVFSDLELPIKDPNKLLMLFSEEENSNLVVSGSQNTSRIIQAIDGTVNLLAIVFTLNYTLAIVNNTYDNLESEDSNSISRLLLAILFNVANIYNNLFLTNGGIIVIYEGIKKLFRGKSPLEDSLIFKLYPKASAVAAFSSVAIECWSYPVIDALTSEMNTNRGISSKLQGVVRIAADVGIVIYHSFAFFKLYSTLLSKLTTNIHKKTLFAMEGTVELYKKMNVISYAKNMFSLTAETRERWGITLFEDKSNSPALA